MDEETISYLHGADVKITTKIKPQRRRHPKQDSVRFMKRILQEGCDEALELLGVAVSYVSNIEIIFPEHDGTFVWPSVFVTLSVLQTNGKQGELDPIVMKFESFSSKKGETLSRISTESVAQRVVTAVRQRLHEHSLQLQVTQLKMDKAAEPKP